MHCGDGGKVPIDETTRQLLIGEASMTDMESVLRNIYIYLTFWWRGELEPELWISASALGRCTQGQRSGWRTRW